jgi:WD40 repeat protein
VLDWRTGAEVNDVTTKRFLGLQLIPDSTKVFYREPQSGPTDDASFRIWDYVTGKSSSFAESKATRLSEIRVLSTELALGRGFSESGGNALVALDLRNGKHEILGGLDPSNRDATIAEAPSVSPDKKQVAYVVRGEQQALLVRDIRSFKVTKRIGLSPLRKRIGDRVLFTRDGNYLLLMSSSIVADETRRQATVFMFDVHTYQITRQFEITFGTKPGTTQTKVRFSNQGYTWAISPDGNMLVTTWSEDERQAFVGLYDMKSGAQLTTASHPPVKPRSDDPWAAEIHFLAFTPDSKYVLSSTYDTRVWQIGELGR